ncbi:hypothetical protein [Thermopirellula anaerolimosa]
MKGFNGLILGLGIGIAAALFNWAYITRATGSVETVAFFGIAADRNVEAGQILAAEDLVPVPLPAATARRLKGFAFVYPDDRATVVGMRTTRPVPGGSILLVDDLRPPPPKLVFGGQPAGNEEEIAMFIPIDTRTIVTSLLEPGDTVSFIISAPTPAESAASGDAEAPNGPQSLLPPQTGAQTVPAGSPRIVGKFKILAIGNRLSNLDIHRAYQLPQSQENVLTISVRLVGGRLEPKAEQLWKMLEATNFRQVGVILHARQKSAN